MTRIVPIKTVPIEVRKRSEPVLRPVAQRGFSLLELIVVMMITMIVASFAIIQIQQALKNSRVNAGVALTSSTIRQARQLAISNRRRIRVTFTAPGTIAVDQCSNCGPGAVGVAVYANVLQNTLPGDLQFQIIAGIPTGAGNGPDNIGTGATAIDFNNGKAAIFFEPSGSAVDNVGTYCNGVVYIARTADLMSSRALTLIGATGRVHTFRINPKAGGGTKWTPQS